MLNARKLQPMKRSTLIALLGIIFINSFAFFFVMPVFLHLFMPGADSILPVGLSHASRNLIFGIAVGLSAFTQVIFAPFVGHLSDRVGRKRVMCWCLCALVLAMVLALVGIAVHSLTLIFVSQLLSGLSSISQPVARAYIADCVTGTMKAFYFSLTTVAMVIALVVGPLVGGVFSDKALLVHASNSLPYWIALLLAVMSVVLLLAFVKRDVIHDNVAVLSFRSIMAVWRQPLVRYLLLSFLVFEFAWAAYYQHLYLAWPIQYHASATWVSLFTSYQGVLMIFATTLMYWWLLKKVSVQRIVIWGLLITGLCLLLMLLFPTQLPQWILVTPAAIAIAVVYPSNMAWMSNNTAPEHQGSLMGFSNSILNLAWSSSSYAVAVMINVNVRLPMLISSVMMLVAFGLMFRKRES